MSASDALTQRWRRGQHSWRHRSEGGFDSSRYEVAAIDELSAKRFVVEHHYSGTYPATSQRYGLFEGEALVGVMVLGIPVQRAVLTNVFPGLEPYDESLELSRFVLLDEVPANAESWFIRHGFRLAAQHGTRGVVSFSDPVPRVIGGRVLLPGHIGYIYQASNARFCGRARGQVLKVLPDGTVLNHRSLNKVRAQDRGHEHVERRLIHLGARPIKAGESPVAWLERALEDVGVTYISHPGNYRYVFTLGRNRNERSRVRIAMPALPYPKHFAA